MNVSGKGPDAERQRSKTSGVPNDPRFDKIRETKKRVQPSLFKLPGVHAVGIGPKVVAGRRTGEPAIIAFVAEKKPPAQLHESEKVPSQIEGIKTDVVQAPKPRPSDDQAPYRPLIGGIQIAVQKLGLALEGTLGCMARTDEPTPRIVLVTNHHVVASPPHGGQTNLVLNRVPNQAQLQLSGTNTPGTFLRVTLLSVVDPSPDLQSFDVGYTTTPNDSLTTILLNLAGELSAKLGSVATFTSDITTMTITITPAPNTHDGGFSATAYGPHVQDPAATIHATVTNNSILQPISIDFSGQATSDVFAAVNLNLGGNEATRGTIVLAQKGDSAETIAQRVSGAINIMNLSGVTATQTGATVGVSGVEEAECDFFDRRVGQPVPTFASPGCHCVDKSIGRVIDARPELDAAIVELNPGTQYKPSIQDIGPVAGSYIVRLEDIMDGTNPKPFPVRKRGRKTLLTLGNVTALHVDGIIENLDFWQNPPEFQRFYRNAIRVEPTPAGPTDIFSWEGDSGAAVVHTVQEPDSHGTPVDTHYIIGILFGANPAIPATATTPAVSQFTFVTPFDDIRNEMQIALETSTDLNEVRTVPAAAHNLAPSSVRPDPQPGIFGLLRTKIDEAESQISATSTGEEYVATIHRHATEAALGEQ